MAMPNGQAYPPMMPMAPNGQPMMMLPNTTNGNLPPGAQFYSSQYSSQQPILTPPPSFYSPDPNQPPPGYGNPFSNQQDNPNITSFAPIAMPGNNTIRSGATLTLTEDSTTRAPYSGQTKGQF